VTVAPFSRGNKLGFYLEKERDLLCSFPFLIFLDRTAPTPFPSVRGALSGRGSGVTMGPGREGRVVWEGHWEGRGAYQGHEFRKGDGACLRCGERPQGRRGCSPEREVEFD